MKITDKRFRYFNAASHATSDGFKMRMRRYAAAKRQGASAIEPPNITLEVINGAVNAVEFENNGRIPLNEVERARIKRKATK